MNAKELAIKLKISENRANTIIDAIRVYGITDDRLEEVVIQVQKLILEGNLTPTQAAEHWATQNGIKSPQQPQQQSEGNFQNSMGGAMSAIAQQTTQLTYGIADQISDVQGAQLQAGTLAMTLHKASSGQYSDPEIQQFVEDITASVEDWGTSQKKGFLAMVNSSIGNLNPSNNNSLIPLPPSQSKALPPRAS